MDFVFAGLSLNLCCVAHLVTISKSSFNPFSIYLFQDPWYEVQHHLHGCIQIISGSLTDQRRAAKKKKKKPGLNTEPWRNPGLGALVFEGVLLNLSGFFFCMVGNLLSRGAFYQTPISLPITPDSIKCCTEFKTDSCWWLRWLFLEAIDKRLPEGHQQVCNWVQRPISHLGRFYLSFF